jgi:hypothetical protein
MTIFLLGQGWALRAAAGLDCVKEIELPQYSFIARRSPAGGTVRAIIKIGHNGKPVTISMPKADDNLAEEVRGTLTDGTLYVESCAGQEVELVFVFRLEGKPADTPFTTFRFQPPNRFVIISEPKKPHILYNSPK